jgi:hypothetical protein
MQDLMMKNQCTFSLRSLVYGCVSWCIVFSADIVGGFIIYNNILN